MEEIVKDSREVTIRVIEFPIWLFCSEEVISRDNIDLHKVYVIKASLQVLATFNMKTTQEGKWLLNTKGLEGLCQEVIRVLPIYGIIPSRESKLFQATSVTAPLQRLQHFELKRSLSEQRWYL